MPEGRHGVAVSFVRYGECIITKVEAGFPVHPQYTPAHMQTADRADHLAHRPARMNAERYPINRVHSSLLREDGQGETPALLLQWNTSTLPRSCPPSIGRGYCQAQVFVNCCGFQSIRASRSWRSQSAIPDRRTQAPAQWRFPAPRCEQPVDLRLPGRQRSQTADPWTMFRPGTMSRVHLPVP